MAKQHSYAERDKLVFDLSFFYLRSCKKLRPKSITKTHWYNLILSDLSDCLSRYAFLYCFAVFCPMKNETKTVRKMMTQGPVRISTLQNSQTCKNIQQWSQYQSGLTLSSIKSPYLSISIHTHT